MWLYFTATALVGLCVVVLRHFIIKGMVSERGPWFRLLYLLYANTSLGLLYHRRNLSKARLKYSGSDRKAHTATEAIKYGKIQILPIPYLSDNYCYVIVHSETMDCILIDPGDAQAVCRHLKENYLIPKAILTTHKHWDHAGGNVELKREFPDLLIFGSGDDNASGINRIVMHKEYLSVGVLQFMALHTPGHTRGHVAYLFIHHGTGAPPMVFTGDLLFFGGCGKFFEGSATTFLASLDQISSLDDNTLIWPGHEYAHDDITFAHKLEMNNSAIETKLTWVYDRRRDFLPTCPSTLVNEKLYNPFLRTTDVEFLCHLGFVPEEQKDSVKIDTALRAKVLQYLRDRTDFPNDNHSLTN